MKEKLIGLSTCQIYKDGFCNFFNFVTFDGKVSAGSLILQSKLISHLSNCDNLEIEYFPANTRLWHFPPQDLCYVLPFTELERKPAMTYVWLASCCSYKIQLQLSGRYPMALFKSSPTKLFLVWVDYQEKIMCCNKTSIQTGNSVWKSSLI